VPVEGYRVIERALAAGHPPSLVIVARGLLGSTGTRARALLDRLEGRSDVARVAVPDGLMEELTEGRTFGPLVGLVPRPQPLEPALALTTEALAPMLVAAELLEPGNVGALVRTALAAGAPGLLTLGGADPFHPKSVRSSMGAIFRLPVARWARDALPSLRTACEAAGVTLVGLVTADAPPLWEVAATAPRAAVVVGGEAFGLDDAAGLHRRATIPMAPRVDSFSVNAAAAIALYEWRRARELPIGSSPSL